MDDAIVPLDSLALTALVHRGTKWRRTFWEATCPELIITAATAATPPGENYGVEWREVFAEFIVV